MILIKVSRQSKERIIARLIIIDSNYCCYDGFTSEKLSYTYAF